MSPSIAAALRALEEAIADTEPAPVSIVLIRSVDGGKVHRAARIDGIPGLMTYEADNFDAAEEYRVIPDLSQVSDELDLCRRCFGPLDREDDENFGAYDAQRRADLMDADDA